MIQYLPQGFFLQFWKGALGPFRLGINWEICYNTQLRHFWSIKNKLAITHTIVIELKENITM